METVIRALVYLRAKHPGRDGIAEVLGHFRRNRHRMRPALLANMTETVRRARRPCLAGANPAWQLSFQPVAVGAAEEGNDLG